MQLALPLFTCVTALVFVTACAGDLDLVRDGEPVAQIVVPADAHEFVTLAAEELNLYLQKMSGAELPVGTEPVGDASVVYLGAPDDAWAEGSELTSLAFDGFVVECDGTRLVLAGNVAEGTLNAVYWMLEELGVRWFIPTELGENVPELATVTVPDMNRRVEPRFVCRRNHGIDTSIKPDGDIWRRRIRITSHALNVPFNRYSHNLYTVLPVNKYGETHPEYYPLINGERRVPERTISYSWQPCTSNPEVVQLTIAAARKWFADHPECNFYSVGMNDGRGWCECESCTALDIPGETFRGREVKSERYFTFVKQVADAVREPHPDKYISCIAYSSVEPLPKNVEIPDNVFVVITQDVGAWHDPAYKQEDQDFARGWAEAAGAFGTYDYTSLGWMLPRSYPHLMAESLRFYDEVGAVAITNEAWPTWWYAGPMMYLRAKLMWDPKQDPDAVLDDFYSGFFGPARDPMKRLYDRFEACMMKEREGRWFYGIGSVPAQIALWTPEDLEAGLADLAEAARLADAEPYAARVAFVAKGFSWAEAILREYWEADRIAELATLADAPTSTLLDEMERFVHLAAHREALCEEIREDELISGIYNRIFNTRAGRLSSWYAHLNSCLGLALSALHARDEDVDAQRLQRIADAGGGEVAFHMRALAWVRANPDAPNLCANPGFEETTGRAPPQGTDWVTTDTPPGWSKWEIDRETDRITWEATGGRSGPRCGRVTGTRNGTFIARTPVKPGELYYTSVWVRSTGSAEQQPKMSIKWQAAEGGWVRQDASDQVDGEGDADHWQLLSTVVQVPDEAGLLIMLPGALEQQPDDVVLFDDARIIRLPDDLRDDE